MSDWVRIVLALLATWRVAHLLAAEDGPADMFVRIRGWLGQSFAGRLMDCFQCLSLWVAAPLALFVSRRPMEWFVAWLALSGGACLLERLDHGPVVIQPLSQSEGEPNHVLRSEAGSSEEQPGTIEPADSFSERHR